MKQYQTLDADPHPAYVHAMEQFLGVDLNSEDSATATWAKDFMHDFEPHFKAYKPDIKTIEKLQKLVIDIDVKVIGGNWCSDTRQQIPALAKVLYYAALPIEKFHYFRVDKSKLPIENDFAATVKITKVPEIIIFKQGKEIGRITETPRETMEKDLLRILSNKI